MRGLPLLNVFRLKLLQRRITFHVILGFNSISRLKLTLIPEEKKMQINDTAINKVILPSNETAKSVPPTKQIEPRNYSMQQQPHTASRRVGFLQACSAAARTHAKSDLFPLLWQFATRYQLPAKSKYLPSP